MVDRVGARGAVAGWEARAAEGRAAAERGMVEVATGAAKWVA